MKVKFQLALIVFLTLNLVSKCQAAPAKWPIADGGNGTLTWSDKNGDLVGTGLSLSTDGLLSGTPDSGGQISFTAMVVDEGKASDEKLFTFMINDAISITTDNLPGWTVAFPYSQALEYTGGTNPTAWSDKNNDLNGSGLSLSSDGTISGTPNSTGILSFIARIVDAAGAADEKPFEIAINPHPVILMSSLPEWTEGRPYSQTLGAFGGTAPLVWIDLNNDLNGTGLTLSANGLLSGTPNSSGEISFTARVTDAAAASDTKGLNIDINPLTNCDIRTSRLDRGYSIFHSSDIDRRYDADCVG